MYYVYVLRSIRDSKLYVGFTQNLEKRLQDHNLGKVISTNFRHPLELVYYEAGVSKTRALRREKYFKTGYGRRFLKSRI